MDDRTGPQEPRGGWDLWGFPKKLAAPVLRVDRDTLAGRLDFG
jgi:acetoacetate decarboxylase